MVENQRRFDGTQTYEIVIDNPTYPDAFSGGSVRQTFPSVRVTDPNIQAPYFAVAMVSIGVGPMPLKRAKLPSACRKKRT